MKSNEKDKKTINEMTEEERKALNQGARLHAIERFLKDIRADLMICDLEGWDKKEYLRQIKEVIDDIAKNL